MYGFRANQRLYYSEEKSIIIVLLYFIKKRNNSFKCYQKLKKKVAHVRKPTRHGNDGTVTYKFQRYVNPI